MSSEEYAAIYTMNSCDATGTVPSSVPYNSEFHEYTTEVSVQNHICTVLLWGIVHALLIDAALKYTVLYPTQAHTPSNVKSHSI